MVGYWTVFRLARWHCRRTEVDEAAPCVGASSAPQGFCTYMMAIGLVFALFGGLLTIKLVVLLGFTLLGVGLLTAIVKALLDLVL